MISEGYLMYILRILLIIVIIFGKILSEIYSLILLERGILCFVRIAEINVLTAQNSVSHAVHRSQTINSKTLSLILTISRLIISNLIISSLISNINSQITINISNRISIGNRCTINRISSTHSIPINSTDIRWGGTNF